MRRSGGPSRDPAVPAAGSSERRRRLTPYPEELTETEPAASPIAREEDVVDEDGNPTPPMPELATPPGSDAEAEAEGILPDLGPAGALERKMRRARDHQKDASVQAGDNVGTHSESESEHMVTPDQLNPVAELNEWAQIHCGSLTAGQNIISWEFQQFKESSESSPHTALPVDTPPPSTGPSFRATVSISKIDFTGMGMYLYAGLMVMMCFSCAFTVILMCTDISLKSYEMARVGYACVGCLVFSMYLVYDTQLILGGRHAKFQFEVGAWRIERV